MSQYSHSEMSSYRNCPRQFYLYHLVGLRKRDDGKSEHHIRYGMAMHEGLRVIYQGGTMDRAKQTFLDAYPVQLDNDDLAKTRKNGLFTLEAYVNHYKAEDRKWRVLSCEEAERFESGGVVHLDRVIENLEHGGIYGLDSKFTGKYLNADFWSRFEPNSQINRYVNFIREKFGECSGFIIDAVSMRYRQRAYRGEPAGFWCKLERQTYNPPPSMLVEEFEDEAYWTSRIEESRATGQFGKNTDNCWHCSFKPICSAGWTWEQDAELITVRYRQTCNQLTDTLRPCALDLDHGGQHSERAPVEAEMEIVIE